MDFLEFYKELEAECFGAGTKLTGLQLLQLELILGKTPSRSFRPVKSAEILWSILEKEKLNGSNFLDWYRNLRIVLRNEQKLHHLEEALPEAPPATATVAVRNAYTCRVAEQQEVACLMLVSMTPEIQKNLEDRPAFEILQELKTMFQQQIEQELFKTVKAFNACKQEEGQSVSTYVLKMKAYLDQMERLGYPMPLVLGVNMILTSLSKDYDQFVQNYNMHGMGKTIPELHAMLKLVEKGVEEEQSQCIWHIRLRGYQKLNKGALDLYVSNGNTAAVEAIGSFDLILSSGMILKRIEKLQHDGLLESIDDESFDVCVSCISGKMARKPFTHASERADDLLVIIHSDVCGPFRTTSRE
ncbi:hypothetical protein Tco_0869456, partial [Tanacetum coccineum]